MDAVAKLERLSANDSVPVSILLEQAGLSRSSYMRWKRRCENGQAPVQKPGPKKTVPLRLRELKEDIGSLRHGRKRSSQTRRLYQKYGAAISRRELNEMVGQVRYERHREQASRRCEVTWRCPNLAWAQDGTEYRDRFLLKKVHIQNLQDLCSCYKFVPLATGYMPCGEELAGHLAYHFSKFGPPLFFKRDNAGNYNHLAVDSVLEEAMVIPINSPINRAQYNGAIEHSQGELKGYIHKWKQKAKTRAELSLLIETAAHDLNHQSRRSLAGRNACQAYFSRRRLRYNKRRRKEVYEWIRDLAVEISLRSGKRVIEPCAWRVAARKWMQKNDLITIRKSGKVLPHSS
jgi:hypothetical protein